jgi:hypothetical protein
MQIWLACPFHSGRKSEIIQILNEPKDVRCKVAFESLCGANCTQVDPWICGGYRDKLILLVVFSVFWKIFIVYGLRPFDRYIVILSSTSRCPYRAFGRHLRVQ